MKYIAVLVSLGLAAGCTTVAEVTTPPVSLSVQSNAAKSRIIRHSEQTVRTYIKEDGKLSEISGAKCVVASAEVRGSFTTPAKVYVPVFKGKPTSVAVKCSAGELTGSKTVAPQLNGTAIGGASAAGLLVAVVTSAIVVERDEWSTPIGLEASTVLGGGVELKKPQ